MTSVPRPSTVLIILLATILCGKGTGQQSGGAPAPEELTPTPAAQPPLRVRVSHDVMVSLLTKRVNPQYPKELRKKRIQGMVTLKILISLEGDVSQVSVVSGDSSLAACAADAVKQWKYRPYLLQGQPVEVETTVQINFTLAGS